MGGSSCKGQSCCTCCYRSEEQNDGPLNRLETLESYFNVSRVGGSTTFVLQREDMLLRQPQARAGALLSCLSAHEGAVTCVVWFRRKAEEAKADDSEEFFIASGSRDCTVRIWATKSAQKDNTPLSIAVLRGHTQVINRVVSIVPQLLSCSEDATVRVWSEGQPQQVLQLAAAVCDMHYSENYATLATACADGSILLWRRIDGAPARDSGQAPQSQWKEVARNVSKFKEINKIQWASSNLQQKTTNIEQKNLLVASCKDVLLVFSVLENVNTHTPLHLLCIQRIESGEDKISSVCWHPDNGEHVYTGHQSGSVKVWLVANSVSSENIKQKGTFIPSLRENKSNTLAIATNSPLTLSSELLQQSTFSKRAAVVALQARPQSQETFFAAACTDGLVRFADQNAQEISTLHMHAGAVNDVAWSIGGNFLASASEDATILVWRIGAF